MWVFVRCALVWLPKTCIPLQLVNLVFFFFVFWWSFVFCFPCSCVVRRQRTRNGAALAECVTSPCCFLRAHLRWLRFLVHVCRCSPKHMGLGIPCVFCLPTFLVWLVLRSPRFGWPPFLCNGSCRAVAVMFGGRCGVRLMCLCVVRLCGNRQRAFNCN